MDQRFASDWAYVEAAVPDLKEYLLSDQLYWQLPFKADPLHGINITTLTPGNLLLALKRLQALDLDVSSQNRLDAHLEQVGQVREQWKSAWSRKAAQELSARLNQWQNFLQDYFENPKRHASEYRSAVRNRAIIDLLTPDMVDLPDSFGVALQSFDQRLKRAISENGRFVWEAQLEKVFPPRDFWYLYTGMD